ncbi:exodeoxyribonuclease I [Thalassotalea sp. HSM 43]|uniref:exodeoxyribonuclease I n=1 Tax=Thalassotalea sp. HSM 43 TaxID=2552945 RepID=UPI0010807F45|nr:exodeoxyribonuclease I [Thalassotalea sp. HSM 43]QBY02895.1 exodeoxyribonuclease I [Thalassotalea sp. HSM 43]
MQTVPEQSQPTLLFHDYETWGVSPKLDKPSQFAAIRTDLDLNIIGEPEVFYCQPPADYLPNPVACLVTGITPQKAQRDGVSEAEFAKRIHQLFSVANTCVVGYNSIRFDDEVSRYLFYRNFYDPYAREWKNNNSRWDIIDMARMCYALAPEGIEWPVGDDGKVSFRLELLTAANGISHEAAHDAMSDVYATIAFAKLIKEKQPKLYNFIFSIRTKQKCAEHINVYEMAPFLHTSGKIARVQRNTSWFMPIDVDPVNKNAISCIDLSKDISPLLELDAEQIKERLYTRHDDLKAEGKLPVGLKQVHINKCPAVAPAKVLTPERAALIGIDREACLENYKRIKQHAEEIKDKLQQVFVRDFDGVKDDPEYALYSGSFFSAGDREKMNEILHMPAEQLASYPFNFADERLDTLLFRYRARNYPWTLSAEEQQKWQLYCQNKLQLGENGLSLDEYMIEIENLVHEHESDSGKIEILKALYQYVQG